MSISAPLFLKSIPDNQRIKAPLYWAQLAQGDWVKNKLEHAINPWLPKLFGEHMLKLGCLSHQLNTQRALIKHQIGIAEDEGSDMVVDLTQLPFIESSIDASLLALTLNFHVFPHQLLRELQRVTVAGGHLIIIGINPISPLGVMSLNPQLRHTYPYNAKIYTQTRVADWLALLGFEVVTIQNTVYSSLLFNPQYTRSVQQQLEKRLPQFGSFYCLLAKKLIRPLTPVKQHWITPRDPIFNPVPSIRDLQQ